MLFHLTRSKSVSLSSIGVLGSLTVIVLGGAAVAYGQSAEVWGAWRYADTHMHKTPAALCRSGYVLNTAAEVAVPFQLTAVTDVRVAFFLRTAAHFSGDSVAWVHLRADDDGQVAGSPVANSQTPLDLAGARLDPRGAWCVAHIALSEPLIPGKYWLCLYATATDPDSLVVVTEPSDDVLPDLSWTVDDEYLQRSAAWLEQQASDWTYSGPDPYAMVSEIVGHNDLPSDKQLVIDPNPAPVNSPVDFTIIFKDAQALSQSYWVRLIESANDDPTKNVVVDLPVDPGSYIDDEFVVEVPNIGGLEQGAHRIIAQVRDDASDWTLVQPVPNPVDELPEDLLLIDPELLEPDTGTDMSEISDDCGEDLCGFVASLTSVKEPDGSSAYIDNTYTVQVQDALLAPPTTHVEFQLIPAQGTTRTETDYSPDGDRWSATFDMTNLSDGGGQYTIKAIARNTSGGENEDTEKAFDVHDAADWYDKWYVAETTVWDPEEKQYILSGTVPTNPDLSEYVYPNIPYFGNNLKTGGGVGVEVVEKIDLEGTWQKSGEGAIDAYVLGVQIAQETYELEVDDNGNYNFEYTSPVLLEDSGEVWSGTVFNGAIGPVHITIHVSIDYGYAIRLEICATLGSDLAPSPVCMGPDLNAHLDFDAVVDLYTGVASFGLTGTPELGFDLPVCFDRNEDPEVFVNPGLTFNLKLRARLCVGWGLACHKTDPISVLSWSDPWEDEGTDCFGSAVASPAQPTRSGSPWLFGPLASPRIASNGAGNALAVWIHDSGNGNPPLPQVYYSYFTGAAWTPPVAVDSSTSRFVSDPRVTFLDTARAVLVVTRTQMDRDTSNEQTDFSAILAQQELYYYRFTAPNQWTSASAVRTGGSADTIADGRAELTTGPRNDPFLIWARERDQDSALPCGTNIMVSRWNDTGQNWSPQTTLASSGSATFIEPDVAFDDLGNAMATWIRDADGQPDTGDRSVEARYFDASTQEWGTSTVTVSSQPGVLWPTVGFDATGQPVILYTKRSNGRGEGTYDYLRAATCSVAPSGPEWSWNFDQDTPVGGPDRTPARWPRMAIADVAGVRTAAVATRTFKGVGGDGYDGEVGLIIKPVDTLADPNQYWPVPRFMTYDSKLDWQIDVDVDTFAGLIRLIWVKPDSSSSGAAFGHGFDGIRLIEIPMGSNVAAVDGDAASDIPYQREGDVVRIRAYVRNTGSAILEDLGVNVAIDDLENIVDSATIPELRPGNAELVAFSWTATDGQNHTAYVIADHPGDMDALDNIAQIELPASAAPTNLQASINQDNQALVLTWNHARSSDPAAPPPHSYRVYRDDFDGSSYQLIGTTPGTSFVDPSILQASYRVSALTWHGAESERVGPVGGCPGSFEHFVRPGDTNRDEEVDLLDVLCVLDGFTGDYVGCPLAYGDGLPCGGGDGVVDVHDILGVLDALLGLPQCPIECVPVVD